MFNGEKVAGIGKRIPAMLIDGILLTIPATLLTMIFFQDSQSRYGQVSSILFCAYLLLLPLVWNGFTVGKKIMNLQIVTSKGEKPTLATMIIRVVVYYGVNILLLGIGVIANIIVIAVRKDNRGIHDILAGTYVHMVRK